VPGTEHRYISLREDELEPALKYVNSEDVRYTLKMAQE
jgi:hypothetical protein